MAESKKDQLFANRIVISARGIEFKLRPWIFIYRYGKSNLEQNKIVKAFVDYYKISAEEAYNKIFLTSINNELSNELSDEIIFPHTFVIEFRFEDVQDFVDYHCGYYDNKRFALDQIQKIISSDESKLSDNYLSIKNKYSKIFANIKDSWSTWQNPDIPYGLLSLLNNGINVSLQEMNVHSISAFRNLHSFFFGNGINTIPLLIENSELEYRVAYPFPPIGNSNNGKTNVRVITFSIRGIDMQVPLHLFEQSDKKALQNILKDAENNMVYKKKIHIDCRLNDFHKLIDYLCGYNHKLMQSKKLHVIKQLMEELGLNHVKPESMKSYKLS